MHNNNQSLQNQLAQKDKEIESLKKQIQELDEQLLHQKNRNMLFQIIDNFPYKVFVKDQKGRFLIANNLVAKMHQCNSVEELIGTTDFDFFKEEDAKSYWEEEKKIIETGKPKYFSEEVFKDPVNNNDRILETYKLPFNLPEGERGILAVQIDITERKEMERQVQKQKDELEKSQKRIQELFDELTENIKTAKFIQEAILPPKTYIQQYLSNFFILYMPMQIVSGDFYWFAQKNQNLYLVAGDCTGHGVAGAFLSLIGNNLLNETLENNEDLSPGEILNILNDGVIKSLHQKDKEEARGEGMDISLVKINYEHQTLQFSGAKNPLYIVKNGELTELKANRFSIGIPFKQKENIFNFTTQEIHFDPGTMIYLSTDGYADQIKYVNGEIEKFKYQRFRDLLKKIYDKPLNEQHDEMKEVIQNWWEGFEQIDDILVIGIRL